MLQQTNNDNKLLFLELFTKELIINSVPKIEKEEKGLEIEKEATRSAEIEERYVTSHTITPSFMILPQPTEQKIEKEPTKVKPSWPAQQIPPQQILPRTQEIILAKPTQPSIQIKKPFKAQFIPPQQIQQKRIIQRMPQTQKFGVSILGSPIKPVTMPISAPKTEEKFDLGKLNMFLADKEITVIECPGPDKFILAKKAGRVSLTKVKLSQKEIDEILKNFSEKARIPIITGIFRTTIGNLTISAVVSDFVGSRFILYKASAYSLIEHKTQQVTPAQF